MTADDFRQPDWCEYLYQFLENNQTFQLDIELEKFTARGKELGFRGVKTRWEGYVREVRPLPRVVGSELTTTFPGQSMALKVASWTCDETGIWTTDIRGRAYACSHPIMPVERIINVDSGMEMARIAYSRHHNVWRHVVVPKSTLASPQKIIELSDAGISVTSENAKHLIAFLQELENLNYDQIPELRSTARLGWINENEFSPYSSSLVFDESTAFSRQYESVREAGSYEAWLELMRRMRQQSIHIRLAMAASFASPLLAKLGVLPAFIHLWSSASATGKTVALMVAASIWGNPARGAYTQSFNSTTVAMERLAEFYNSMPLILDELQQARTERGGSTFSVYKLSQGSGKSRSNRAGGLDRLPTWNNFVITTGESPLVEGSEGAGALARVINIELLDKIVDAKTGNEIVSVISENYGHAGKKYIKKIQEEYSSDVIKQIYDTNLMELLRDGQVQDKQAMSAAALLTGDMLASVDIFDDKPLTIANIRPLLLTTRETSVGTRAYEHICGWVSAHQNGFVQAGYDPPGAVMGAIEGDVAYIVTSEFNRMIEEAGYQQRAVLSALKADDKLITQDGEPWRVKKRIGSSTPWTYAVILE